MTTYIDEMGQRRYRFGSDDRGILTLPADRYIGVNPAVSFTHDRAFLKSGILQSAEGQVRY